MNPLVSIIITTRNEERNIANCLESIINSNIALKQYRHIDKKDKDKSLSKKLNSYKAKLLSYEIIVVDNNSTDKTKEIAKRYTDKVYNKGPERSAQRNYGMIDKAKGKYVMYLDADMILSSTVIEKAVEKLESSSLKHRPSTISHQSLSDSIVALYVPEIVLGNSFWNRVRRFERSFYDGTAVDCVRIIRKDIFKKVGGFDLSMTGPEDWDLDKKVRKAGKTAVLCRYNFDKISRQVKNLNYERDSLVNQLTKLSPKPLIYHNETEFNLKKYLQKKQYYSKNFDLYFQGWGKDDPDIKKQFGLWYRYLGVFLENKKWHRLISHPFLAMGMYVLRTMVGINYLITNLKTLKN